MKVGDLVFVTSGRYFGISVEWDKHGILWVCPLNRNGLCHERCIPRYIIPAQMTFVGPVAVMKESCEEDVSIATYNQKTKTAS